MVGGVERVVVSVRGFVLIAAVYRSVVGIETVAVRGFLGHMSWVAWRFYV